MTPLIKNNSETGKGENRQWQVNPGFIVDVKVAGIYPYMGTADMLYIEPATGAIHKNTHCSKVGHYTVNGNRH
jgi:hypothetical protein